MFKDDAEFQKSNVKISADTIVKNLAYMGILSQDAEVYKKGLYIPTLIPTWTETFSEYVDAVKANPLGTKRVIDRDAERTIFRCAKVLCEFITKTRSDDESISLPNVIVKFAAAFLHWQFQSDNAATDLLTKLKKSDSSDKSDTYINTVKNIFTDTETDEYGMKIFEELQQGTVDASDVSPATRAKDIQLSDESLAGGALGAASRIGLNPISGVTSLATLGFIGAKSIANAISMEELFEGVWDNNKSIFENLRIVFKKSQRRFVETMNLILGIHKYVESIKILLQNIEKVNVSITRTENLLTRKGASVEIPPSRVLVRPL
jgi:hypothetical protein